MNRSKPRSAPRRTFLKASMLGAGIAGTLGAVSAISGNHRPLRESAAHQGSGEESSAGYHESDHIRRYYRTLRE